MTEFSFNEQEDYLLSDWILDKEVYFAAPWLRNILIHSKILFLDCAIYLDGPDPSSDSTITIEKMSGLFIMCGCGMGLGFIVMISEYCSAACRDVRDTPENEVYKTLTDYERTCQGVVINLPIYSSNQHSIISKRSLSKLSWVRWWYHDYKHYSKSWEHHTFCNGI